LAVDDFNPLAPGDQAVDVGPLAMARAPLIEELAAADQVGARERLLALVLDTALIAEALQAGQSPPDPVATSVPVEDRAGLGSAVTARGPVFHRVILDADGRVESWRAVAPTDWHFAPEGPVARALSSQGSPDAMRRLVASFDPCAAWELAVADGAD
jgi:Ni,Fe-hydrogenase I large subunit